MDQKRILWIVAAVGIFLLVVVGAALILYSPERLDKNQIAEKPVSTEGWVQAKPPVQADKNLPNQDNFYSQFPSDSSRQTRVGELTVIAENATIISDKANYVPNQNPTSNSMQPPAQPNTLPQVPQQAAAPQYQQQQPTQVQIEVKPIKIETASTAPSAPAQIAPAQTPPTVNSVTVVQNVQETQRTLPQVTRQMPSPKPERKPVAKADKPKDKVAKATPKPKAEPKAEPKPAQNKTPARFWVQAASYTNKKYADEARSILEEEKIPSEMFTYTAADGKLYYRVRVGPYSTKSEAEYWRTRIALVEEFKASSTYVTNSSEPLAKK